jgi:nucleoside-diphosphate-sugar epimerase
MQATLRPLPAGDLEHMVALAESDWRALRGARLFITGGTGFLGLSLLEGIAAANARLGAGIAATVLSRSPERVLARAPHLAADPLLRWHAGDVRDFSAPQGPHDHVIHAGASSDAALYAAQPALMRETIAAGTRRALDYAAASGAASFLYLSSGAVYGRQPPGLERLAESHAAALAPEDHKSVYAEAKREAEALCGAAGGNLRPKIARAFAFIGPHLPLDAHFAAGNFLRDALEGRPIRVRGDGTPLRSYLHTADMVVWLLRILVAGRPLQPYNVGSGEAIPVEALARETARLRDPALPVVVAQAPGDGPPERYVPDVGRARAELGLEVKIGLRDALERTFKWLQAAR